MLTPDFHVNIRCPQALLLSFMVVESGTHEELICHRGRYYQLAMSKLK